MKLKVQELVDLLELANKMREVKGDELLEDLPESIPNSHTSCLVARAFNYGCMVSPARSSRDGYISFKTKKDALTYANIVNIKGDSLRVVDCFTLERKFTKKYIMPLTHELNLIANKFDARHYGPYIEQ